MKYITNSIYLHLVLQNIIKHYMILILLFGYLQKYKYLILFKNIWILVQGQQV